MAIGKNKRVSKAGRKGGKKKIIDPYSKKEWYTVKAPSMFTNTNCGNTLVSRSQGLSKSSLCINFIQNNHMVSQNINGFYVCLYG